jgi:hypothetical protein
MHRAARGGLRLAAALTFASCGGGEQPRANQATPAADLSASIRRVGVVEELLLALEPHTMRLSRGAMNLSLGDARTREDFDDEVRVRDVGAATAAPSADSLGRILLTWTPKTERRVPRDQLDLLPMLFERVKYFEHAKFYFVSGDLTDEDHLVTRAGFTGLGRTGGGFLAVDGKLDLAWRRVASPKKGEAPAWRIAAFDVKELRGAESGGIMFEEVLDAALPSATERERARRSVPYEMLLEVLLKTPRDQFPEMPPSWTSFMHPAVAIADVDRDGLDDLYMTPILGKAVLLRNRGDGTFNDIAPAVGLDIENNTAAAIFADFDNDGDPDLFLGRTLARSMYLENQAGRFVDRSREAVNVALPMLVSSISAADYDGDGLLDVYISTYGAAEMIRDSKDIVSGKKRRILEQYLADADVERLWGILARTFVPYLNFAGPPNILLHNLGGGRFEDTGEKAGARLFKNTFQATWGDYDKDGDPDLYCANDFAPNNLLRNDGGVFTDVTEASGTLDQGFGMGAAFGDYDNDGRQDLYVSNMYSKAGLRITAGLPGLNEGLRRSARGNTLFRNRAAGFEIVSAPDGPLRVHQAGWSWGGQFADFDNDGWLDIYVTSGFYTAPKQVEQPGDL